MEKGGCKKVKSRQRIAGFFPKNILLNILNFFIL